MITEESLRKDVLEYLRTHYSIKLEIPVFRRQFSDILSLRLFRSPLGENLTQNRYQLLVRQSQDLLRKDIINTDRIKEFGEHFFETVTQDIQVLQANQDIRRGFARMRDQISFRVEDLGLQQRGIEQECKAINHKEEILTFLEGSFRGYLAQVKQVSEQYEAVNDVQVLTSINIDSLYSQRLGNEEDYLQHYQPFLEVMQRLKNNMVKLYQELNRCEYFQLPLRSVNFLANCKNLLLELEPFLIRPDCVFNRLIFHVVRGQKENNRLIGRIFHANTAFTNDVISDIFKAFFLSHIFKDHYRAIKARIEQERDELIKGFETPSTNSDNFYGQVLKTQKFIGEAKAELDQLRQVIGMGKDKIMRDYLGRKQCKKFGLLFSLQQRCGETVRFSQSMLDYLKFIGRLQFMRDRVVEAERHLENTISTIKEQETINLKPSNANNKEINQQIDQQFQQSYLLVQEGLLQLGQVRQTIQDAKEETSESYFSEQFFPKIETGLEEIGQRFRDSETELLNSFQSLRKEKLARSGEARKERKVILQELSDYFETKVVGQAGHEIRNEDAQGQEVKDNIVKVERVQFLLSSYINGQNRQQLEQLSRYKANLQCLLQVFEGSMDQKIFQNFMEKFNFDAEDWRDRITKVRELVRELGRYVGTLKKILVTGGAVHFSKVSKLVKNRMQLYEIIQDIYEQFVVIYETCKANSHLNPTDHGLKLFDEASYKYVLMLYQYRNRTRAETEELKDLLLPRRTLNYLLDDIYEPFLQIFGHYVGYTQPELLTFTLRLEHALNFKLSQTEIARLFEQTLAKVYTLDFFITVRRLSEELVQLNEENQKVLALQKEEVMIYNLKEFQERIAAIEEHVMLAEAVLRGLSARDLRLEVQLNNRTLMALRKKLIGDWDDHRQEIERSLAVSRADDFSHNEP